MWGTWSEFWELVPLPQTSLSLAAGTLWRHYSSRSVRRGSTVRTAHHAKAQEVHRNDDFDHLQEHLEDLMYFD